MMSVPRSALHSKVRKAVPDQRQSVSFRFMPELRPIETTGIPLYGHPAWLLLGHIPPFVRIFPLRADGVMGKQDTFCLCRPSCLRNVTARKSPFIVCPADFFYPPKPSFITFINFPLYIRTILPLISVLLLLFLGIPRLPLHSFFWKIPLYG